MNTTHRTAGIAVVLLAALVFWAPNNANARTPQVRWYHWHPTARQLHEHYGSKVVIGLESMQDFKALRVEYGFGVGTVREIPALHAVVVQLGKTQLHALLTRAPNDPRIRYVSPIRRKRQALSIPNDPFLSTIDGVTNLPYEWTFLATHVDRALEITHGDPHVVVGVIDTGVAQVPDLAGKIDSLWTVSGTTVSQVFEGNDTYGHGTAVASLIAANDGDGFGMAGFGGDTHVIAVDAGSDGLFNDANVALALTKLVSLGVRVVNMSIGGKTPSDPILVDAIHSAAASGVLLVASAGNNGTAVTWPAADLQPSGGGRSYGLAVGATDVDGRRATFSDWGAHLSLMAPGTYGGTYDGVVVALPPASQLDEKGFLTWSGEGDTHYGYIPGTSFAAPEVAGVAALVMAANPELTSYQVADILKESATRTASDWTPDMGCGILDAGTAVELATSRPASAWADTPNTGGAACSALGSAPATWPTEKNQAILFAALADRRVGDPDFKVKASATSALPVTLSASGPCAVAGKTVHLTGVGWCTITASQDGNDRFNPAQPITRQFHVGKAPRRGRHV